MTLTDVVSEASCHAIGIVASSVPLSETGDGETVSLSRGLPARLAATAAETEHSSGAGDSVP